VFPEEPGIRLGIRCHKGVQWVAPGDLRRLLRLQFCPGHDPHALF
jgi:hypothetical protein